MKQYLIVEEVVVETLETKKEAERILIELQIRYPQNNHKIVEQEI